MAVQDYELLLRVRADLQQALQGMNGLSDSLGQVDKQARAAGESADQATARIQAMVAATAQQAKVQESVRSTQERAAEAIRGTLSAYDQQGATVARTRAAVDAYRASVGKGTEAAAAAVATRAQTAEMAKLAAQIDPTIAALDKLDKQEATLQKLFKAGAIGADDFARFSAVIDNNRAALVRTGQAMHGFSLESANARRELGRLVGDIANGNWGRFQQTSLTLANYTGLMSAAFSPLGLAIVAVTGAIAGFAIAAVSAAEDQDTFNKALAQTGDYAGVTAGQLEAMAQRITPANGSLADSRVILQQLVASGRLSGAALESVGRAAANMAALTGQSADKAAAAVLKMFDGTAASALKANEQYHFLTTSIYDHIKALEEQGDTQAAIEAAADAYNQAAVQRQQQLQAELSATGTWWDRLKGKAAAAWEEMKRSSSLALGLASDEARLEQLNTQKAAAALSLPGAGGTGLENFFGATPTGWTPEQEAERKALQARVDKAKQEASDAAAQASLNDGAVAAAAALDQQAASLDRNIAKTQALKKLDAEYLALWKGSGPDDPRLKGVQAFVADDGTVSFAGGAYDKQRALVEKQFAGPKPRSDKAQQAAAVTAQQDLIKALGDEQGALNPVAKVWAEYNDQVDKANQLAAKAKTVKNADVAAIDAQRDALVKLYATARDNALDKLTDKDREAWEKLQASLHTPVEVRLDKAMAQLRELNALLEKGVKVSADDLHAALQRIGQNSVAELPKYQGVDASVGGVSSELSKNYAAQQDLEKSYTEQLAALREKFRTDDLQQQQIYMAAREKLDADYATKSRVIEQSRQQLQITSSSEFFGQLAVLQQSSNRKIATVGKAAAVAKAIIDTYQSATSAYAAMASIPYVGPALGAAAAAAAIAAGLANVAAIRSQPVGFATGGRIRGAGTGTSDSIPIMASDGEYMQRAAAVAYYGEDFMDAVNNLEYPRDASSDRMLARLGSTAGFESTRPEPMFPANFGAGGAGGGGGLSGDTTHIHVWSAEEAAERLAQVPSFQKAVVHIVGDNPRQIQGKWGR